MIDNASWSSILHIHDLQKKLFLKQVWLAINWVLLKQLRLAIVLKPGLLGDEHAHVKESTRKRRKFDLDWPFHHAKQGFGLSQMPCLQDCCVEPLHLGRVKQLPCCTWVVLTALMACPYPGTCEDCPDHLPVAAGRFQIPSDQTLGLVAAIRFQRHPEAYHCEAMISHWLAINDQ